MNAPRSVKKKTWAEKKTARKNELSPAFLTCWWCHWSRITGVYLEFVFQKWVRHPTSYFQSISMAKYVSGLVCILHMPLLMLEGKQEVTATERVCQPCWGSKMSVWTWRMCVWGHVCTGRSQQVHQPQRPTPCTRPHPREDTSGAVI